MIVDKSFYIKLNKFLKYNKKTSLNEGLKKIISWHKDINIKKS